MSAGHSSNQMLSAKYVSGHSQFSGFTGEPCFSRSNAVWPISARSCMSVYRFSPSGHSTIAPASISVAMLVVKLPGLRRERSSFRRRNRSIPSVPQVSVRRHRNDRRKVSRHPAGRAMELERQRFAMQCRRQIDEVGVARTGVEQRAVEPLPRCLALAGGRHMRIVLQVVAYDQRRTDFSVAPAANPLPGAE